ncbi:hypothetical protein CBD41_06805 [bacterium TMED181]|nr:hypothetical protein [Planctomycetota bacterium]OUW43736.1 MAG: hypothetical protein CBD41_06805 [bacterium TMED181]
MLREFVHLNIPLLAASHSPFQIGLQKVTQVFEQTAVKQSVFHRDFLPWRTPTEPIEGGLHRRQQWRDPAHETGFSNGNHSPDW